MIPNQKVISAVEKLGYQVTASDVAAQSSLSLQIANREVANLASLTGGNLLVAEDGEISYKFSSNFRDILLQRSFRLRLRQVLGQVWRVVFYVIRISFGIVLIISIVLVVLGIIAALMIISKSSSEDDNDRERRSGGINLSPIFWLDPGIIFLPDYDRNYSKPKPRTNREEQKGKGFLENIFAFLFGDGNPNYDLEERRYRLIANVIRNNDGVVIGEQIFPYLDAVPRAEEERGDYVLPVLARFNGYPTVTEAGEIVYRFPDLQRVASRRPKQAIPNYLEEQLWQFNQVGTNANLISAGLGIFYLVASLFLGFLLRSPAVMDDLEGLLGFINSIFVFLLGYAILFLAIPLVRYGWLQITNQGIRARNAMRQERSSRLPHLRDKLEVARQFAIQQTAIDEQQLAYSTESDLLTQEFEALFSQQN